MRDVVFVCLHGAAKSLIAAQYFTRMAAERGLELRGVSAGLEPDAEVPAPVVTGLAREGFDVQGHAPQQMTGETIAGATRVVHFGCDLGRYAPGDLPVDDWGDVPAVSDGYEQARKVIVERVERLVESIVNERPTLLLSAADVRRHLSIERSIAAVETAFRLLGSGEADAPVTTGLHVSGGGFHIKAGVLDIGRKYFAAKTNGNFPANPRRGLPTVQGVVILADAANGSVLAVVDSVELTARRTAAATAVAARYLARPDSTTAAICGCGFQADYQVEALRAVLPLERLIAVDINADRAAHLARRLSERSGVHCIPATLPDAAAAKPDVWITCTTSTDFFLYPEHVRAGAFIAAVGVDNENKRELAPALLAQAHVVADLVEQCRQIGDLHHALAAGVEPRSVRELGHIVALDQAGRSSDRDICVFDSTGIGLQDVAACAAVFEAALLARDAGAQLATMDFAS